MNNRYSTDNVVYTSGGISFTSLLTIVFIVLKLCNVIDWSWIWVLAPLWIGAAIVVLICIVVGLLIMFLE